MSAERAGSGDTRVFAGLSAEAACSCPGRGGQPESDASAGRSGVCADGATAVEGREILAVWASAKMLGGEEGKLLAPATGDGGGALLRLE